MMNAIVCLSNDTLNEIEMETEGVFLFLRRCRAGKFLAVEIADQAFT